MCFKTSRRLITGKYCSAISVTGMMMTISGGSKRHSAIMQRSPKTTLKSPSRVFRYKPVNSFPVFYRIPVITPHMPAAVRIPGHLRWLFFIVKLTALFIRDEFVMFRIDEEHRLFYLIYHTYRRHFEK